MKVFVDIDGGCSCYEVNVVGISIDPKHGGQELDVKLSDLLGVSSDNSLNTIDDLISKHQDYVVENTNKITGLRAAIRDLEVELSEEKRLARVKAEQAEIFSDLKDAVKRTYARNLELQKQLDEALRNLKDKNRGYRFAGFKDKHDQLWTPVTGRNGMFEFRGEMYSAGFLKNNAEYLAVPYHEEME